MEYGICPATLLVYDTSKFTVIIVPWRARSSGKSLGTTERCVLKAMLAGGPNVKDGGEFGYLDRNWEQ